MSRDGKCRGKCRDNEGEAPDSTRRAPADGKSPPAKSEEAGVDRARPSSSPCLLDEDDPQIDPDYLGR